MKKVLIALIVFITACNNVDDSKKSNHTINVSGNSTIKTKPDKAVVRLDVNLSSSNKKQLLTDLNQTVTKIVTEMRKLKIDSSSIFINDLDINWRYIYDKERHIKGILYNAYQTIEIKTDFTKDKTEDIVEVVSEIPKLNYSIYFELSQPKQDSIKDELIKLALKDAEKKAKIIAETENLSIVDIDQILYHTENPMIAYKTMAFNSMANEVSAEESVTFSPKEIEMNDNVNVLYIVKKQ